jgi:hypothetical protein
MTESSDLRLTRMPLRLARTTKVWLSIPEVREKTLHGHMMTLRRQWNVSPRASISMIDLILLVFVSGSFVVCNRYAIA